MDPEDGWIRAFFRQKIISFKDSKTTWQLTQCLAEKAFSFDEDCDESPEASAIYFCVQKSGPKLSCEAVMRVRVQYVVLVSIKSRQLKSKTRIPRSRKFWDPDPKVRGQEASKKRSAYAEKEFTALRVLTAAGCPYTPRFLSRTGGTQDGAMWVPGGWTDYILMEKVPGVAPLNFWDKDQGLEAMTRSERDEVRFAFKKALS